MLRACTIPKPVESEVSGHMYMYIEMLLHVHVNVYPVSFVTVSFPIPSLQCDKMVKDHFDDMWEKLQNKAVSYSL